MSNNLSGRSSLAYLGTNAAMPPNVYLRRRAPTANDFQNVSIGDFWIYIVDRQTNNNQLWTLLGLVANSANWVLLSGSSGTTTNLIGNTGGEVTPLLGVIEVIGDGTTVTVDATGPHTLTISAVGTGTVESLKGDDDVVVGPTAGIINLKGSGNITTSGDMVTSTETIGLTGITQYNVLVGGSSNTIDNINPSTAGYVLTSNGVSATPTFQSIATDANSFPTDSGTATPSAGVLNILGSGTISTSGSVNTVNIAASPSAFYAYTSTTTSNATGDGTVFTLPFDATLFDQGSNFNTSTYGFTAPSTGIYSIGIAVAVDNITVTTNLQSTILVNGSEIPVGAVSPLIWSGLNVASAWQGGNTVLFQLNAGDVVTVALLVALTTKTVSVGGAIWGHRIF